MDVGYKQNHREEEQQNAGQCYRQAGESDQRQDRADASDHTRQDRARRGHLGDQAVDREQEQQEGDVGIDQRVEQGLRRRHVLLDQLRARHSQSEVLRVRPVQQPAIDAGEE